MMELEENKQTEKKTDAPDEDAGLGQSSLSSTPREAGESASQKAGNGPTAKKVSPKKMKTNGQNALRSTGPKTPEGKDRVRRNALKHGLLSREILLPDEDPEALEDLASRLRAALQPVGLQEELQVDIMTHALWRLGRIGRLEAGIFLSLQYQILLERAERQAKAHEQDNLEALTERLNRTITDKGKHQEALAQAEKLRKLQEEATATFGLAFVRGSSGADAFSKLARYAASIERMFYRAYHELQRLQQARLGWNVPPPLAVDINVSGVSAESA